MSVYCDWVRSSNTELQSVWRHVQLSQQNHLWDALACYWDIKLLFVGCLTSQQHASVPQGWGTLSNQPTNNQTSLPCQAPGITGSVLGLAGILSVYCDWVGQQVRQVWSATPISMWQHVQLSEQICPWDTLASCWDDKQQTTMTVSNCRSIYATHHHKCWFDWTRAGWVHSHTWCFITTWKIT